MAWHSTACFISCKTRFSSYLFSFLFLPHSLLRSCVFLINNHHTKMRFLCLHREKKRFFCYFFCAALACFNSSAAVFFGMIWDDALFYCQNYCRHIDLNCSIIYHNYALLASNAGIYLFFCFCWSSSSSIKIAIWISCEREPKLLATQLAIVIDDKKLTQYNSK